MEEELQNGTTDNTELEEVETVEGDTKEAEEESLEFDDSDEESAESNENEQPTKKKQTQEENHMYAEMRRKNEAKKKAKLERQKYNEGLLAGTDGINPYTHGEMKDEFDIEEFEIQKEMVKKGLDPIADYPSYIKEMRRNEAQSQIDAEKEKEWYENDRIDFFNKNPEFTEETFNELLQDKMFEKFSKNRIGKEPLNDIFQDYLDIKKMVDEKANEKALLQEAKRQSSPGPIDSSNSNNEEETFTYEQLRKMSQAEVDEKLDKIQAWLAKQTK